MSGSTASLLLVAGWLPMMIGLAVRRSGGRDPAPPRGPASVDRLLLATTWIACAALTIHAVLHVRHAPPAGHVIAGVVVFLAAMLGWTWARISMGRQFAQIARAPSALVTRGAYRFVRHPMYVATSIAVAGQACAATTSVAWTLAALAAAILALRARREDRLLEAAFGDAWRRFAHPGHGVRSRPPRR